MEVKVAAFSQRPPSSSIRADENHYKSLPTSVSFPSYVLSSPFFFVAQCSATLPLQVCNYSPGYGGAYILRVRWRRR